MFDNFLVNQSVVKLPSIYGSIATIDNVKNFQNNANIWVFLILISLCSLVWDFSYYERIPINSDDDIFFVDWQWVGCNDDVLRET